MGFKEWIRRGWDPKPRAEKVVPALLRTLVGKARVARASWIEIVLEPREAFEWDVAKSPLTDASDPSALVGTIYYCVPSRRFLDILVAFGMAFALADELKRRCASSETVGPHTRGTFRYDLDDGVTLELGIFVEHDSRHTPVRTTVELEPPEDHQKLDLVALRSRWPDPRPARREDSGQARAQPPES